MKNMRELFEALFNRTDKSGDTPAKPRGYEEKPGTGDYRGPDADDPLGQRGRLPRNKRAPSNPVDDPWNDRGTDDPFNNPKTAGRWDGGQWVPDQEPKP
jgi:hypothetical protein